MAPTETLCGAALAAVSGNKSGGVAERLKAVVLKTTDGQPSGGSNPSPSAIQQSSQVQSSSIIE